MPNKKNRKISFSFNYESEQQPEPLATPTVVTQVTQPQLTEIHPQYAPTVVEPPLQLQSATVGLAPTLVDEETQLKRGAIISCVIVCGLVGLQTIHPPTWNWIEAQQPVKELQKVFSGLNPIKGVTQPAKKKLSLSPTPKKGDFIAGYRITSPWGWRGYIGEGKTLFHRGTDAATPINTPIFAIAGSGETVAVRCWYDSKGGGLVASLKSKQLEKGFDYLHLKSCKPGLYKAGQVIGATGDSGVAKGQPHLHLTQKNKAGEKEPPNKEFVEAALKP